MFLKRLADHIRRQDWFIVIIELLVVSVGLMMAFQVDRWWEAIDGTDSGTQDPYRTCQRST